MCIFHSFSLKPVGYRVFDKVHQIFFARKLRCCIDGDIFARFQLHEVFSPKFEMFNLVKFRSLKNFAAFGKPGRLGYLIGVQRKSCIFQRKSHQIVKLSIYPVPLPPKSCHLSASRVVRKEIAPRFFDLLLKLLPF